MGGLVSHKGWSDIRGSTEMIFPFPPERGIFLKLQVYRRVGISLLKVYKREGKSVIWACERFQKGFLKSRKLPVFVIDHYLNNNAFTAIKRDTIFQ